jgi:hypothetical protein
MGNRKLIRPQQTSAFIFPLTSPIQTQHATLAGVDVVCLERTTANRKCKRSMLSDLEGNVLMTTLVAQLAGGALKETYFHLSNGGL